VFSDVACWQCSV